MANELTRTIQEMLEVYSQVLLGIDAENVGHTIEYTEKDALNAVQICSHVLSNIVIRKMIRQGLSLEKAGLIMGDVGADLKQAYFKSIGKTPEQVLKEMSEANLAL